METRKMSKWIKKGDKVVVLSGNDRGRTGEVLSRSGEKVIIQGINIRKRHTKARSRVQSAQVMEREMGIHVSKVALCNESGKRIKPKVKISKEGEKQLVYLEAGKEHIYRNVKKK